MNFLSFCAAHGLIVDHIRYGEWVRVPTVDKPRKRNGAYRHLGDVAFVQNHATMVEPSTWFPDKDAINKSDVQRIRKRAVEDIAHKQKKAAEKARWIISQCKTEQHAYLDSKGFGEEFGLVWLPEEGKNILVIPMTVGGVIAGCQMIDRDGNKKFLYGQRCSGAEFKIGSGGIDIWCEGYATALSIKACLEALRVRYTLHVCFSAGNLKAMAKRGVIVADNDESKTGETAALEAGLKYYLPPTVGTDFNDYHKFAGTFRASQELRKLII